jgi:histidyl-tRNA synthetase
MKRADKSGSTFALILGENELEKGEISLKSLRIDGEQITLPLNDLATQLQAKLKPSQQD